MRGTQTVLDVVYQHAKHTGGERKVYRFANLGSMPEGRLALKVIEMGFSPCRLDPQMRLTYVFDIDGGC